MKPTADKFNATRPIQASIWGFLRQHVFTRENAWVIVVAAMLLAILVLGTMGVQPRFVYSGF